MAKRKLSDIELRFKGIEMQKLDYSYQSSVSFSQFSTYLKCPNQWYLTYIEKKTPYSETIHTIFGTAIHNTLQNYFKVMYNESGAKSDKLNLIEFFEEEFKNCYSKAYNKSKVHFSNAEQMAEFYEDGSNILKWIQKRRNKLFTIRNVVLIGIEVPITYNLKGNLYLSGYLDLILYDIDLDKLIVYDIKTSTKGWNDKDKKDETKTSQLILYKEFLSRQYRIDIDKIDVEFFIVKRKIWENSEFPIPRVQTFTPTNGKTTRKKILDKFENFLKDCFDESGKPIKKSYIKNVSDFSCKWCPYKDNISLCDKNSSS